jgi:SAM-dependent methyltransferase
MLYDIRCGAGFWMDTYHSFGIGKERIVALDLATPNVERLQALGYAAFEGDTAHLPFSDAVSDDTICQGVLHHLDRPADGFSNSCVSPSLPAGSMSPATMRGIHGSG